MKIEDAGSSATRLIEIWRLYRMHSKNLGFMPRGAFKEAANKGTLLVATKDSLVVGYLLYNLPGRRIALTHLCVADSSRGEGLARAFIDEVRKRHPHREGIVLTCRNDFEAHKMWPRLDFEPVSEGAGRGKDGLPKTRWLLDFGQPNLLSELGASDRRIQIAVDTDVFIDLVEDRSQSESSRALTTGWATEVSIVVVTKTIRQELGNNSEPVTRNRRQGQLAHFLRGDHASDDWTTSLSELENELGLKDLSPHDQFDLEHVARAASAGIGFFASRDARLIRRFKAKAWELYRLRIGTPANILADLWNELAEPYVPAAIENTSFKLSAGDQFSDSELYQSFSNRVVGERKKSFDSILQRFRREPDRWEIRVLQSSGDSPVALVVRTKAGEKIAVPMLRVAGRHSATVGRQLVHLIRTEARNVGAALVQVSDPNPSPQLPEVLLAEGFIEDGSEWAAPILDMHASAANVAPEIDRISQLLPKSGLKSTATKLRNLKLSQLEILDLEKIFAPLKIIDSKIPTFVVPIRAVWAEQLFDTSLSASTLFPRDDLLGMSREHVYYSGAPMGALRVPARIVWYVSRDSNRAGTGAIRAVSVVDEVVEGRALDLYRRFSRLGIYKREQVLNAASKSRRITAIRFSQTELLKVPIRLAEFKELMLHDFGHKPVLRSPQKLPDGAFDAIYKRGMHESTK